MTDAEAMFLRQRDEAWLEIERLRARLVLVEDALRKVVRHEPWPPGDPGEGDFRAARALLDRRE
jgi:hypothetical protein